MTETPENYRYHTDVQIRYGDLDTLGHVNNSRFLTYLEQARVTYFADHNLWDGGASELGLIVARICVDYKLPLRGSDQTVDVWTRISHLGNKSFTMQHLINRSRDGATAGTSEITMVCFNYVADQTVPIPQIWRDTIIAYEPGLP